MKSEASTPKIEPSTTDVKEEVDESDTTGQVPDALQEDAQDVADAQPLDSEDSLSQEHVASELRRLAELRVSAMLAELRVRVTSDSNQDSEGGAVEPQRLLRIDKEPLLQIPDGIGKTMSLMRLKDQGDTGVGYSLRIHTCSIPPSG